MKRTSTLTKVAGFFFSVLMSVTVIGATVAGLESRGRISDEVVTLDQLVVSAPAPATVN